MASFIFNYAKQALANGSLDWDTGDIRILLVDNTCDADKDDQYLASIGTLGELSGTGYSRKALTGEAVNVDLTNDRAELDADDVTWTGIDAGEAAAAIIYLEGASDAARLCIAYIDSGGFPIATNGGDMEIAWNAEGIIQLA